MHFKLIIAFVDSSKTDDILNAAREQGAYQRYFYQQCHMHLLEDVRHITCAYYPAFTVAVIMVGSMIVRWSWKFLVNKMTLALLTLKKFFIIFSFFYSLHLTSLCSI